MGGKASWTICWLGRTAWQGGSSSWWGAELDFNGELDALFGAPGG
jgi:hypothetical protein